MQRHRGGILLYLGAVSCLYGRNSHSDHRSRFWPDIPGSGTVGRSRSQSTSVEAGSGPQNPTANYFFFEPLLVGAAMPDITAVGTGAFKKKESRSIFADHFKLPTVGQNPPGPVVARMAGEDDVESRRRAVLGPRAVARLTQRAMLDAGQSPRTSLRGCLPWSFGELICVLAA